MEGINSTHLVFYMFRTSYGHHQEDCILHAALYDKVFHVFMQAVQQVEGCAGRRVFLMMHIKCSKYVEGKKNWIKTLI